MREITLSKGKVALVDDEDYSWLSQWKWHCTKNGYAGRIFRLDRRNEKGVIQYGQTYMHRQIMQAVAGMEVDHRDNNKLNNCQYNLRLATSQQNNFNWPLLATNKTGYKGVSPRKGTAKYEGYISKDGKRKHLGLFNTKEEAALAYNKAAIELFGPYANLNKLNNLRSSVLGE